MSRFRVIANSGGVLLGRKRERRKKGGKRIKISSASGLAVDPEIERRGQAAADYARLDSRLLFLTRSFSRCLRSRGEMKKDIKKLAMSRAVVLIYGSFIPRAVKRKSTGGATFLK